MGFQPGGVKEFVKLDDTPSTFAGQGSKLVKVNAGATALEFGNVTPSPMVDLMGCIYDQFQQKLLEDWVEAVTGTGTTTYSSLGYLVVSTGAGAGSTAIRSFSPILAESGAAYEIDWDDELILQFTIKFYTAGIANTKHGFARLAKGVSASVLGDVGVGFYYIRNGVKLLLESHDGVGREETDLGTSSYHERLFSAGDGTILRIHHRPNGEAAVKFYELNTTGGFDLIATHTTRVPSGKTSAALSIAANNVAADSDMQTTITHAQLYRPIPTQL